VNVLSANQKKNVVVGDMPVYGGSDATLHFVVLYATTLMENNPDIAEQRNASTKLAAHEFMHVLSGHLDCTHSVAHDNIPGKPCLLNSPGTHEQWINGHVEGHRYHLDAVRANAAFYNP
jgi:hypothetical protein